VSTNLKNMSQNKKYSGNSNDKNKSSNPLSATPYKRKYGLAKFLEEVDPFFFAPGELEARTAAHNGLAQLLEGATVLNEAFRKEFINGTVVSKTDEGFYVNIRRKYDAFVPLAQGDGLTVGQEAEFYVIASSNKNGIPTLSFSMAKGWRQLEEAQGTSATFAAHVFSEAIIRRTQQSAGLRIEFAEGDLKGIRGFVPNGEMSRNSRSKDLVGTTIQVTVITAEPQHGGEFGNLVMSNKEAQNVADEIAFNSVQTKTIVQGNIIAFIKAGKSDTKMSALVRLENGLVAMLHRSETIDAKDSLSDMYKVGDEITVAVRHIDHDKKRIGLSLKLAAQMTLLNQIAPKAIVNATILRKVVYGYFASIGGGMEGLIHQSDLALVDGKVESFQTGETVKVMVIVYNPDGTRLALGRKQLFEQQ
jgi:ribosomal protein S1